MVTWKAATRQCGIDIGAVRPAVGQVSYSAAGTVLPEQTGERSARIPTVTKCAIGHKRGLTPGHASTDHAPAWYQRAFVAPSGRPPQIRTESEGASEYARRGSPSPRRSLAKHFETSITV
jgi:hypothetical protein